MRATRTDAYLALAFLALGFAIGAIYVRAFVRAGGPINFGQPEFGAAVAMACGKGFVDPGYDATPGLSRFLQRKTDTFSCAEFPAHLPPVRPNLTQGLYRYLMSSVALVWRIRGVSWWALWPLFGVVYGATVSIAYGLFRLGMSRVVASAMTVMLAISAVHVGYVPYLRDYAKAPFILGLMLLMAVLARGPLRRSRVLAYAAAFGGVLGLGFGFRNDLLICVPPFAAVIAFCLPGQLRENLRLKAGALAVALLTFVIVAWPILTAYRQGSNTGHVALLGLMTPFDKPLGIQGSIYDWGYTYLDGFANATANSYSARVHGRYVTYLSADYDRTMAEYILRIARTWPADIVVRAYASVLKTLEMPFAVGAYTNSVPWAFTSEAGSRFYLWQQSVLRVFLGRGAIITAVALILISGESLFAAVTLLVLLLYFAGYPALQFHIRHFFHLEFIAWWAIGFVAQRLWSWTAAAVRARRSGAPLFDRAAAIGGIGRAATFAIVAGTLTMGTVATLRAYQSPHTRELLGQYAAAPVIRLTTEMVPRDDRTLIRPAGLWSEADSRVPVSTRYVVTEFDRSGCDAAVLPVTFRYDARYEASDFSGTMRVTLLPGVRPTRVFFPAYYNGPNSHFDGIEVPRGFETCVRSVSAIADLDRFPLLPGIVFSPEWTKATLFHTLADLESFDAGTGDSHALYTVPPDMLVTATAFDGLLDGPGTPEFAADVVHVRPEGGWTVSGRPQFAISPLLKFSPRRAAPSDTFVVEGDLRDGAINVGLTRDGSWARNVEVRTRGSFLVTIAPPHDGVFGILAQTQLADTWPANRVGRRLSRFVWWVPGATFHTDLVIRRLGWATRLRREGGE